MKLITIWFSFWQTIVFEFFAMNLQRLLPSLMVAIAAAFEIPATIDPVIHTDIFVDEPFDALCPGCCNSTTLFHV